MAEKTVKSLKQLRKNVEDMHPKHQCDNCKCKRFSPCGCTKKEK